MLQRKLTSATLIAHEIPLLEQKAQRTKKSESAPLLDFVPRQSTVCAVDDRTWPIQNSRVGIASSHPSSMAEAEFDILEGLASTLGSQKRDKPAKVSHGQRRDM